MSRWFGYVQRELEKFIGDDPFDDIVAMLGDGTAFSFSRFGDGEFNAIIGVEGANCDGHPYYPDLGARLRQIVESKPGYLMGLQPLAVVVHGARQILALAGDREWVLADSFHLASVDGRLGRLFDALGERSVTVVGPEYLGGLSESQGWRHRSVPRRSCWTEYDRVREELESSVSDSGDVVLFCASMMSNVLIDDLYRSSPGNSYIDTGSVLDPYAGVKTREYHGWLSPEALAYPHSRGLSSR